MNGGIFLVTQNKTARKFKDRLVWQGQFQTKIGNNPSQTKSKNGISISYREENSTLELGLFTEKTPELSFGSHKWSRTHPDLEV